MAANRTIYLLSLFGAIAFYTVETVTTDTPVWFAWVVLFVVLLVPVLSLLLSLPQMLKTQVSLVAPSQAEEGEKLNLLLRVQSVSWLPLPEVRVRLLLQTRGDTGQGVQFDLRRVPREGGSVQVHAEQAGLLCAELKKFGVCDYLGLFRLPRRRTAYAQTAVLPTPVQPDPMPDLTIFRTVQLVQLPQGSFSEDHDHRPYRDGDNVRSVHWKLSQKTDDLIVREPVAPARLRCHVLLDPAGNLPELQSELGQLRWLCSWLAERRLAHTVLWMGEGGLTAREIREEADVVPMLAEACASPLFPENAPVLSAPDADWYCRIVPMREVAS